MNNASSFEVVVIGAGLTGIIAAQRFLDAHPEGEIAILEKEKSIGGVFNQRRIYDEFWTQWTVGLSEFSDMALERPPETDCHHDFYKAKYTTAYLEKYVHRRDRTGRTLRDRIVCDAKVCSVSKIDDRWVIRCSDSANEESFFSCQNLMVASGLCSHRNMPELPGKDSFRGHVLHSEDFGEQESDILASKSINNIVVIGAGKSAADMVYESVKAGKEVSWIIRTGGTGPAVLSSGKGIGPYKNAFEAGSTRLVASLSPSIFNSQNMWTNFLQKSTFGNALLQRMLAAQDGDIRKAADYKGRKSTRGFEKLEYETPFFWQNGPGGLLHHDDFWEVVASRVSVYQDSIHALGGEHVHLASGGQIKCDAILCGTGWKRSTEFFDQELLLKLGLPYPLAEESKEMKEKWSDLLDEADKRICDTYPMLTTPPKHPHQKVNTTTYRLYQGMAPMHDESILIMNHIITANMMLGAEIQAMWAVAYFDKHISLPSVEERERSIAHWVAFSRRRYLSSGELGNAINFETITYTDRLLEEMGLSAHKKGWWKNKVEPFWPRDLARAWREYLEKYELMSQGAQERA